MIEREIQGKKVEHETRPKEKVEGDIHGGKKEKKKRDSMNIQTRLSFWGLFFVLLFFTFCEPCQLSCVCSSVPPS
jgi:hypothetical protein